MRILTQQLTPLNSANNDHFRMRTPTASLAIIVVTLLSSAGNVIASRCIFPPCGEVYNNSPWTMKWADLDGGEHYCDVYNWHGSDNSPAKNFAHRKCTQYPLDPGVHKGGWSNDRTDVDGFCFYDRSYRVRWLNAQGLSFTLDKGVWTKISSAQTATCSKSADGMPSCSIV